MVIEALLRRPLRWAATGLHRLRRAWWKIHPRRVAGIHAVTFAKGGNLVLVKLRYADGWRLPGGGRNVTEDPRDAMLRELREEIGLVSHGTMELVSEPTGSPADDPDLSSLFIVRDVIYRPGWSFEVEAVTEAPLDRLPDDLAERTRTWLDQVRPML